MQESRHRRLFVEPTHPPLFTEGSSSVAKEPAINHMWSLDRGRSDATADQGPGSKRWLSLLTPCGLASELLDPPEERMTTMEQIELNGNNGKTGSSLLLFLTGLGAGVAMALRWLHAQVR